ncbi:HNH endonuclease [Pedobacter alluvionis]|uniref:Uncharacterized protein (TIGR02646 family) n=1 Tax=Pedobacter alluvionis TaxID=475253 RepID=A0A497Y0C3_9SPHI|nr:HNH endonuclease [Pedobacter alluvionis]RLJ72856.1 uncharacterized protein (TIGR02646 family) [Pedobacter alluvionis]TFB29309.1 hypothetical protein E3V97_19885 [Pedobacter alluvionis]
MSDKINNHYIFDKEDNSIIKSNFNNYLDWDKSCFDTVKEKIKKFLRSEQNNKCCYCKKELKFDLKDVDIEHIIPKSAYSKFTFHKYNLALSCPACNTIKGSKEVVKKIIVNYPRDSKNIKIIHSHFDNYSENIKIENDCVFIPLTKKGSETITVCELYRLITVEQKAKESLIKKSDGKLLRDALRLSKNDKMELINELLQRGLK